MYEMSYQAIYNYWFQEIAPVFWIAIVIYLPVSFILFPTIWNISKYKTNKKNDRELKNQSILTQRVRDKMHYYEKKIRLQRQLIKRLNAENVKLKGQRQRTLNIYKEGE